MSRTIGIFTESSDRNPEIDLCRLCREKHGCYYSIFTSNVAYNITVKDALHDLVGLQITVGDGLPTTMCPLCLKKLTEFSVFKKICLKSNAILRQSWQSNCCRSFEGQGAADDNSGPSVETKGCIQDVIENNSQPTCSSQTTEIYLPVPDLVLPRDNELFHVKDENEGNLSEENYPMLYTSVSAGISTDVSDPLANDELSDPVIYECSSIKNDQISDDEEGYVVNDCSDGATSKRMHHDISNQAITLTASQDERVEAQGTGGVVVSQEWTVIGAKKEPSLEENAQLSLWEDGDPIDRSTVAHDSITNTFGFQTEDEIPIQTTSTSYLRAEGNVRNSSIDECTGPTALVTQIDSNAGASLAKTERNLMDEDLKKCGAVDTDKKTNISIPNDRQCNARIDESHKISVVRGAKTFFGEEGGFDAPNTTNSLRLIRINRNERNDCETPMEDNEEVPNCSIKNPGNSNRSNKNSFHCRDAFNDKNELTKHTKSHSVAHNFDAVAESSTVEKSCSFSVCKKSFSRCNDLVSHMRSHKGDRPFSCVECEKSFLSKYHLVRHIRTHTGEKPYSCHLCEKSFSDESTLARHVRMHAGERPYSCSACNKSFSRSYDVVSHMRSHTGERPFSCNECEKSFLNKYCLVRHIRTHTGEKPFTCKECERSFSDERDLVKHVRKHTGEKPYSCSVCNKSFSRCDSLASHMRSHKGERPFSCNECDKSFLKKYGLVRHIRTHTGEKPHSCSICSKSFTQRGSLNAHIRSHTGKRH